MTTHSEIPNEERQTSSTPKLYEAEAIRREYLDGERAKWLSVEEAAYVLSTSRDTIFRMISNGLSVRREGKVIRIHVEDLRPRDMKEKHEVTRGIR